MKKLFFLKNASNFSKKLSDISSSSSTPVSHQYKSFSTLSHKNPFHYHTCHPHQPVNFTSNGVHSFIFTNRVQAKRFLCNTNFRVSSKCIEGCRMWFMRAQFPRRNFGFDDSGFNSFRRSWRSWFQRFSTTDVVLGLIISNVAVFMLWRISDRDFMMKNFTISLDNVKSGRVHTMITSAFSHIDMEHIFSNMIGLYFFGMNIGRAFGTEYLLKLYLAGAIGGSVFYLLHHAYLAQTSKGPGFFMDPSKVPGLGASGAVNAIMLLDIFLFPTSTLYLEFIIPVPAILLGIFLIGKDMLRIIEGDSRISGSAHLGGAAVAAIAWARIRKGIF